jgi:hypothetical protein
MFAGCGRLLAGFRRWEAGFLVLFQPEKLVFFIALAQFDSSMKLP